MGTNQIETLHVVSCAEMHGPKGIETLRSKEVAQLARDHEPLKWITNRSRPHEASLSHLLPEQRDFVRSSGLSVGNSDDVGPISAAL